MAALAILEGERDPAALFRFAPTELADSLTHYAGVLRSRFARGKAQELAALLKSWSEQSPALPIHEIHPGWLLEVVKEESPRVIGLICRYLPGHHVRFVIENLPREIRDKLPTLNESFGLPVELINEVKSFLGSRFFQGTPPNAGERFSVRHIPWMSARDIRCVVRELGYSELRKAFVGMDVQAIQAFLTRFPLEEAKELRAHIEKGPAISDAEHKRAQAHIVGMNLDVSCAADLPYEIGLSALAEAVAADETGWIEGVVVRLDPAEGYSLRRYVKEAQASGRSDSCERRQTELLGLIRELADNGKIAQYWGSRADDEITQSGKPT